LIFSLLFIPFPAVAVSLLGSFSLCELLWKCGNRAGQELSAGLWGPLGLHRDGAAPEEKGSGWSLCDIRRREAAVTEWDFG
jgi:hypothetical protein